MRRGFVIVLADGVTIVVVGGAVLSVRYRGERPPLRGLAQEMSAEAVKKRLHDGETGR